MEKLFGTNSFITLNPPKDEITVGSIKIYTDSEVVISTQTGKSFFPTITLNYEELAPEELSLWVLFHTFVTGDIWTLQCYMGTIPGIREYLPKPFGLEKDYADFLNIVYRSKAIKEKMSYGDLYSRFILLSEQQIGMVKNLLLDLKPGSQWSHSEMADYSYWRMVIDYSIVEAIMGRQPSCDETHTCSSCHKIGIAHNAIDAKVWAKDRLLEIIGDKEKTDQYLKVIWTVRQNIRHKTAHESDYPYQRPSSQLRPGNNQFNIETVINSFKTDTHALTGLKNNMHEVTRILLLDNILQTKIFPDIRPYLIRSGGIS